MTPDGRSPRVVLGLPAYNGGSFLPQALESLLSQTYAGFRLVALDDRSEDGSWEAIERYRRLDPRIVRERNAERVGLTRNWQRVFELSVDLYPGAEFFAWISDHDVWHPRWLEVLVRELDRNPRAALAYSRDAVLEDGNILRPRPLPFPRSPAEGLRPTLSLLARQMRAGQMVYGLFRRAAVTWAGGFSHVLAADRLLITQAALWGELLGIDELLWYKRPTGTFSLARQRSACFPGQEPLYARLPWSLTHAGVLVRRLVLSGGGAPALSRPRGAGVAALYLWHRAGAAAAAAREKRTRAKRWELKARRARDKESRRPVAVRTG